MKDFLVILLLAFIFCFLPIFIAAIILKKANSFSRIFKLTEKSVSVTTRVKKGYAQPHGGYINPRQMDVKILSSCGKLNPDENISPVLAGTVVDYLSRFMLNKDKISAFESSIKSAFILGKSKRAKDLLCLINGLDDISIEAAIKLVGIGSGSLGTKGSNNGSKRRIIPSKKTIENVRIMVNRSLEFFRLYGPVIKYGYTFEGGYTKLISGGSGDFMTRDTLWDFKVSASEPISRHTFQLLIYYIMGLHSIYPEYKSIKQIGIFNPRLNKVYTYSVNNISSESIIRIEKEVIGY